MIFMTKSRQRRDHLADRIRSSLSDADNNPRATGNPDSPEIPRSRWQRFAYQLPAWALLLGCAAVPAMVLLMLLNR